MITLSKNMKPMGKILAVLVVLVGGVLLWQTWQRPPATVSALDDTPKVHKAPTYDVESWQVASQSKDMKVLMTHLGTPTLDETLDFYGNPATQYRYHAKHEPPLLVVVGDGTLELVWYHAVPKDDDSTKAISVRYAQKVHAVMTAIYGKDGKTLMQALLTDKPAPKMDGVIKASCQAYECQIIINAKQLGINLKPPITKGV